MVCPLVQCYLGVAVEASDTADRMVGYAENGYEEIGFLDTNSSISKTKDLVGLDVVPMKSKGSDIVLDITKVVSTMC